MHVSGQFDHRQYILPKYHIHRRSRPLVILAIVGAARAAPGTGAAPGIGRVVVAVLQLQHGALI